MIVVIEKARTTNFTTLAHVKSELGLTDVNVDRDDVLSRMIEDASAAIVTYCDRAFARERVTEQLQGYDRTIMMLDRTPVMQVDEVRYKGVVVPPASGFDSDSGWRMQDPSAGFLFRQDLFTSTQPRQTFIETEIVPQQGRQDWHIDYTGGYLMPGDNLTISGASTANGFMHVHTSDNSYNFDTDDEVNYFPIIVAGETVRMTGFVNAPNNGRHVVVSRTRTKLVVAENLVTEPEPVSGVQRMICQTLPADLERRCLDTVKSWFLWIKRDTSITSERLGDWSASYASAPFLAADNYGLPPMVTAGLQKWARVV